jgi:hypothetical protein
MMTGLGYIYIRNLEDSRGKGMSVEDGGKDFLCPMSVDYRIEKYQKAVDDSRSETTIDAIIIFPFCVLNQLRVRFGWSLIRE